MAGGKTHSLVVNGRRISYRYWPGRGCPLVLLHGLLDSSEGWGAIARRLTRPVYAFDLPGFGGSDPVITPTLDGYADQIAAAIKQIGIARLAVCGHSLGGGVAMALAEQLGDSCEELIMIAPVGFGPVYLADHVARVPDAISRRVLALTLANPLAVTATYMTFVSNHKLPPAGMLLRLGRRCVAETAGAATATRVIAGAGHGSEGFADRQLRYSGPVQVIWGDQDRLVPLVHVDAIRRVLPQSQLVVLLNVGHHVQCEAPLQLAAMLAPAPAQNLQETAA